MSFTYESMLSENKLRKIKSAVENHFKHYDPQLQQSYGYDVTVGYECDVVSTIDGKIIFNDYDHPINRPDRDYTLGTLKDSPEKIINNYKQLVINKNLDQQNYKKERRIYNLYHSDIIAFD